MTRKRGQPESRRRTKRRRRGPLAWLSRRAVRLVARYPAATAGTAAFLAIFALVAVNAVWYQPGAHPAPILAMRDRADEMPKVARKGEAGLTVDTLLAGIKGDDASTPSADGDRTGSIRAAGGSNDDGQHDLVREIQQALAARRFYFSAIDGRASQKTRAAIEAFQAATARPLTGEPSQDLLEQIRATHRNGSAVPMERPNDVALAGRKMPGKPRSAIASVPKPRAEPSED
ncbi:peptidoglycan-binding domain-containing protein [Pararhizobium mangrovi]|uniref:Peptidoglycan binding-like domain-containing protein n=1 Tax=Pararhizobium mangrovi TaxID=2590452 RepID=A0A506UHE6_9HYPH|nr:peptidoglycan-binding protein [Pararhizobium mangrovi]TPW32729.1 hypothetical protein FJU11_00435 [Pararhizobium mangrovi]